MADRSVHVDVVHGVDLIDRCVGGRDTFPGRAGVVDQHVQVVRPFTNGRPRPPISSEVRPSGTITRFEPSAMSLLAAAAPFVARAEEDHPSLFTEPSGGFETESFVGSRDEHRGLRRIRHAEVTNGFARS